MAYGARGITIFAVPYDSGYRGLRMGAGPEHLLSNGMEGVLAATGREIRWRRRLRSASPSESLDGSVDRARRRRTCGAPRAAPGYVLRAQNTPSTHSGE